MALENCPLCQGTGWKLVPRERPGDAPGKPVASFDRPGAAQADPKVAVPCSCGAQERAERVFERARIPKRYEQFDFESFVTDLTTDRGHTLQDSKVLQEAKMLTQAFVRDYPGADSGLLFMGNSGAGKTHLAVAALRDLLNRGHSGYFCEYGKLLREIQASYSSHSEVTEMGILGPVLSAEVLVIDDLGSIKPSDWVRDVIGYILNTRYSDASADLSQRRCTMITTNYFDEPAEKKEPPRDHTGKPVVVRDDTLADRIGARTRSRLYEMCRTIQLRVPDFRREVRTAGRARA
jgi:DNA replication protein DnaC